MSDHWQEDQRIEQERYDEEQRLEQEFCPCMRAEPRP